MAGKIKDPSGVKEKISTNQVPCRRIKYAGGGLTEATDRLKRQGLRGGECVKGMNRKSLENKMAKNGLDKWFKTKWVDIGSRKKMVPLQSVAVQNKKATRRGSIQNAYPCESETDEQRAECGCRQEKEQQRNTGPKPTKCKTFAKRSKASTGGAQYIRTSN